METGFLERPGQGKRNLVREIAWLGKSGGGGGGGEGGNCRVGWGKGKTFGFKYREVRGIGIPSIPLLTLTA